MSIMLSIGWYKLYFLKYFIISILLIIILLIFDSLIGNLFFNIQSITSVFFNPIAIIRTSSLKGQLFSCNHFIFFKLSLIITLSRENLFFNNYFIFSKLTCLTVYWNMSFRNLNLFLNNNFIISKFPSLITSLK